MRTGWGSLTQAPRMGLFAAAVVLVIALGGADVAQSETSGWRPGANALGEPTYAGAIDEPLAGAAPYAGGTIDVRGWVLDTTAQGWSGVDRVDVFSGTDDTGTPLASTAVRSARPDVAQGLGNPGWRDSGFLVHLPPKTLAPGPRTLTVAAHTPDKGSWLQQVTINVTDQPPFPFEPMIVIIKPAFDDVASTLLESYGISGYAIDRNASPEEGAGVDRVQIYLDAERGAVGGRFMGDAELGAQREGADRFAPQFWASGFDLSFAPTNYASTRHDLYIYARSSVTGRETMVVTRFSIVDP